MLKEKITEGVLKKTLQMKLGSNDIKLSLEQFNITLENDGTVTLQINGEANIPLEVITNFLNKEK